VPGQPKLNALAAAVEEAGGDAVVFDRIADGAYLTEVAEEWDVSSQLMRKWIRLTPERRKAYEAAKRDSGDALVEAAGEVLDNASVLSSQHIAKARAQSGFKTWLAGKRDREQYGDDAAQVNLNVNLNSLHLEALRSRARVVELETHDEDDSLLDSAGQGVLGPSPD